MNFKDWGRRRDRDILLHFGWIGGLLWEQDGLAFSSHDAWRKIGSVAYRRIQRAGSDGSCGVSPLDFHQSREADPVFSVTRKTQPFSGLQRSS